MFIDLFKDKVKTASPEELRALAFAFLMDLEATEGALDANDVRTELMNSLMVHLLD